MRLSHGKAQTTPPRRAWVHPAAGRAFLAAGTRTGKLAVTRRDGSPLVVPIWFVLDGADLVFTTGERSIKGWAMRRDPRVALCVDDETPPYAFARIDGTVTISRDLDEMLPWSTAIAARYMGADQAESSAGATPCPASGSSGSPRRES